ncbi:MAG: HAMP domain-containing histidine kinase [Chloroflexi bacterium]|nr:HAMP domain-containing histidine kinase [Chloroflexota bacterium]
MISREDTEYTPEEAALLLRLRVFITMRWLAILGILVATLVASRLFSVSFPTVPVFVICGLMAVYNLLFLQQLRGLKPEKGVSLIQKARTFGNIHIFLDLLALTAILHFTGGIENPFLFYFVFHIILASIALQYRIVYLIATSAIALVALLVVLEYTGIVPHVNLAGFAPAGQYRQVSYIVAILASLTTLLYGSAYMATAISGELRKRQREVVQLRERLLEEKTVELERSSQEIAKLEEERNRFLRFLGVAAHDLKAPLAAIQSYIGVMLGGFSGDLNEKQKTMLQRSSLRINELLKLISDLLDIPRIETGQIVPEMKEVSLCQLLKDCTEEQRALAKEKGLEFELEMPESLPDIRGSAPRLQQVITNLVNNAINYTSQGRVVLRVTDEDNQMKVEVMDTGIGIPAQDLPRMFEDFFRASNVDKKGTGLGLSIAKRIVEAHGGKIWVESPCPENNCGSKFTFTLPKKCD